MFVVNALKARFFNLFAAA